MSTLLHKKNTSWNLHAMCLFLSSYIFFSHNSRFVEKKSLNPRQSFVTGNEAENWILTLPAYGDCCSPNNREARKSKHNSVTAGVTSLLPIRTATCLHNIVASNSELNLLHFLLCCLHVHSASVLILGKNCSIRAYSW
jgi:hypothetical protein